MSTPKAGQFGNACVYVCPVCSDARPGPCISLSILYFLEGPAGHPLFFLKKKDKKRRKKWGKKREKKNGEKKGKRKTKRKTKRIDIEEVFGLARGPKSMQVNVLLKFILLAP